MRKESQPRFSLINTTVKLKIYICSFLSFFFFSASTSAQKKVTQSDLETIFTWMSGTFSSETQAKSDSDFYHISLKMKPIWKQSKSEKWLYVEQAMASTLDKPYRQRIYHLTLSGDSAIISTVFEVPKPERFISGVTHPEMLDKITKDSLIKRVGCAITLNKMDGNSFSGSTPGKQCLSSLRGAAYATSKVAISKNGIVSWDQGWDAQDKQVWGARKEGYDFVKKENW